VKKGLNENMFEKTDTKTGKTKLFYSLFVKKRLNENMFKNKHN